jgi:membrane peptidoglycan carboxypeptidase
MKLNNYRLLILLLGVAVKPINAQDLPPVHLDYASYAVASDGKLIGYYGEKRRVEVKSTGNISKYVLQCLVATEDRDFYNHNGVSIKGLARGLLSTITGNTQGGSTLTMQLARNLFLTQERTVSRKLTEIELAQEIEKKYSKNDILLLYLNTVYFGHSAWGIWAASQEYFRKTPDQLSLIESATIVGLLQSPNGYDPDKHYNKLLARRNEVLYNLVETGKLSEKEYNKLKKTQLGLNLHNDLGRHFLEQVRKETIDILKSVHYNGSLSNSKLKVTTTLNYEIQQAAEDAVKEQWNNFPASMKDAQAGLVSVEPGTGMIKAMIGGNPESPARGLNRGSQIKRQPGSSFKPFLYGSMLKDGYTLAVPLEDKPIVVDSGKAYEWRPQNSDETYTNGVMPMYNAIQHSVNLSAAYAITNLTSPDSVVNFAHLCGIHSEIPSFPSIALGTAEVSPLEMAAAIAVFASYGTYAEPYSIIKIEDENGKILFSRYSRRIDDSLSYYNAVDSATCYLLTTALESVVEGGTATSVKKYYRSPAAGKTGTTQNYADAWFVGYNPQLSTAIWIGFDNPSRKLRGGYQYGGTACAPIWGRMMHEASQKVHGLNKGFTQPSSVIEAELCIESGELAGDICPKKTYLVNSENMPEICSIHYPNAKERYDHFTGF